MICGHDEHENMSMKINALKRTCNNISKQFIQIIVMTLICKELRWMKSTRPNALQIEM